MSKDFVFRVLGWEVRIRNIKAYDRLCKEYDEAVDEYCKEQAEILAGENVG
jgi:hypothetical protein